MKKVLIAVILVFLTSAIALGMYEEDSEPSSEDKPYTRDKESPSSITDPEIRTTMSESEEVIRGDENNPPEEDSIEKNEEDKEGFKNLED